VATLPRLRRFAAVLSLSLGAAWFVPPPTAGAAPKEPPFGLAALATDPSPWLHLEANSLQRSPVYLGATPRELALRLAPADGGEARLPATLRDLGDLQLKGIRQSLIAKKSITAEQPLRVEGWPIRDDRGRLTWAFARWQVGESGPWRWLTTADIQNTDPNTFAPTFYDPTIPGDFTQIFGDPDDYGYWVEPTFGNTIWAVRVADPALAPPLRGWLPSAEGPAYSERADLADQLAVELPPPARLGGRPVSYPIAVGETVTWPESLVWTPEPAAPGPAPGDVIIDSYPADFADRFREDLLMMDGEAEAVFPISGRRETFTSKNNALPDNDLHEAFDYLEERYDEMGLPNERQDFTWRGMPQTNVIARIEGADRQLPPVLVADHVDTAFDEDLARKDIYLAVPGAIDNSTGSAAVLRTAAMLKDRRPRRAIWLVHFTGEEFPADDLGARALVSEMLGDRQDVYGLVLIDMIGFAGENQPQFQLSAGPQENSLAIASIALDASADVSPQLTPLLRTRYDDRSYLYNTDGIIFSENGYPVVLFNEYLNYYTRLLRAAYHDTNDTSAKVNFDYAVAITKVVVETVARISEVEPD
jgi:hypothetical protein